MPILSCISASPRSLSPILPWNVFFAYYVYHTFDKSYPSLITPWRERRYVIEFARARYDAASDIACSCGAIIPSFQSWLDDRWLPCFDIASYVLRNIQSVCSHLQSPPCTSV
jgi:hypothetical protein